MQLWRSEDLAAWEYLGTPFSLQVDDKAPVYEPEDVAVPPMLYDGPLTRSDLTGYFHEVSRTDHYAGRIMEELERQSGTATGSWFL